MVQPKTKQNKTNKLIGREWGRERGKWMKTVKRYILPAIRQINIRDVMYNMMDSELSSQGKIIFFFFYFVSI